MKKFVFLFIILCTAFAASEAAEMSNTKSSSAEIFEAQFIQKRHLQGLPKPIESKGSLILWENRGILWSTLTPFPCSILITTAGVYQLEEGVKVPLVKAGGNNIVFETMAGIFVMKDENNIKGFTVDTLPPVAGKRTLRLTPDNPHVKNAIASITLQGNKQIEVITIVRPNGDHDEITIDGHTPVLSPSDELKGYFNE